jgi:endoglucanase
MNYPRPISKCDITASDLAGEIVAALSAASLVFKEDQAYSRNLVEAAEKLFELATKEDSQKQGTYTMVDDCGGEARNFYNSSGYEDELGWGGTWLFFATGNTSYLEDVSKRYELAKTEEKPFDKGIFYWNNKLTANGVILL